MDISSQYNKLRKPDLKPGPTKIKSFLPKPTDVDYTRGYIKRYFAQKVNDLNSPIREISSDDYIKVSNNSFYNTTSLKWRIAGPIKSNSGIGTSEKTVSESNQISIRLASSSIKNLKLYLPNLLQFYK
jgi:hypothetical protein